MQSVGLCGDFNDEEMSMLCMITMAKCIKYASAENLAIFLPKTVEVCSQLCTCALPIFGGKTLLDPSADVDADLLDGCRKLMLSVVRYKSDAVDPLCCNILKLVHRQQSEYCNFALEILIEAIESQTVSVSVINELLRVLSVTIENSFPSTRQNIVYIMNITLRRDANMLTSVQAFRPKLEEWWNESLANSEGVAMLVANIASLFVEMMARDSASVPYPIVLQAVDCYPPVDRTETASMSRNILTIMSRPNVPGDLAAKVAAGIAKLLTVSRKQWRKSKLDDDVLSRLSVLLKAICSGLPGVWEGLVSQFSGSSGKLSKLQAIIA